ncbi:MAG: hypothetical protein AVDCRST_MAG49-3874, partial [uncultured Thermomicrobiales bacterium]
DPPQDPSRPGGDPGRGRGRGPHVLRRDPRAAGGREADRAARPRRGLVRDWQPPAPPRGRPGIPAGDQGPRRARSPVPERAPRPAHRRWPPGSGGRAPRRVRPPPRRRPLRQPDGTGRSAV